MMDRDVLKELASLRNKKVFGPSDFYDMVDTVAFAGDTIDKLQTDVADFRHERNAAQQRAEQAERERDEAREAIRRAKEQLDIYVKDDSVDAVEHVDNAHAILYKALRQPAPLDWTPKTGAEIAADMEGKPAILPPDFDIDAPAPTVKADTLDIAETNLHRARLSGSPAYTFEAIEKIIEYLKAKEAQS